MAPKHHVPPLSGGDRKALTKELEKARAMTTVFANRAAEKRAQGEALIREADNLSCQSWNERLWADGGPPDPSPTIDPRRHQSPCEGGLPPTGKLSTNCLSAENAPKPAPLATCERGGAVRVRLNFYLIENLKTGRDL